MQLLSLVIHNFKYILFLLGEDNKYKCEYDITKTATRKFNAHTVNEETDEITIENGNF